MPRTSPGRQLGFELNVAARVKLERARTGMTFDALAQSMASVGCVIHPTALHKIEKSDPPRRITVDELMAFSSVFDVPMTEFVQPVEVDEDAEFRAHLETLRSAASEYRTALEEFTEVAKDFMEKFSVLDPAHQLSVRQALGPDVQLTDAQGNVHTIQIKKGTVR